MTGTVESFAPARGVGFLRGSDGRRYFFQLRDCDALEDQLPTIGEQLAFTAGRDRQGLRAVAIVRPYPVSH